MIHRPTRRSVLGTAALSVGALATSKIARAASDVGVTSQPSSLRFVHLTDMHVQPELGAADGWTMALQSLAKLDPQPAFIINGGDHIMDAYEASADRCKTQWDLYDKVVRDNLKLKVYPLVGNHDIYGWGDRNLTSLADGYGKAMAMDRLGLKQSYYSFDAGGWHFLMLDSVARKGHSYMGNLDVVQKQWLKDDLAAVGSSRPIIVISHMPILAACVFCAGAMALTDEGWSIPEEWMHRDLWDLLEFFKPPLRVPLLLSGHIHLLDRITYGPHTFICDGAICGNWWRGPYQDCPEGYGVIDLHPDGTFEHQYVPYGWVAKKP